MNEARRDILQMLSAGQITVDEAERLMAALDREPSSTGGEGDSARPKAKPKYLRIVVDAEEKDGRTKANVRVPMQLLRAGVRLASLIPVQAQQHVNHALKEQGVAFDLSQIKPENLEELVDQLGDLTVDVDNSQVKVAVFAE